MADYDFQYRLNVAPEARNDGSGMVDHDIDAVSREQGSGDPWVMVPARHQTVSVPADDLLTVLAMPNGGAKVAAYKDLLVDNQNTVPVPNTGWSIPELEATMDANDESADAADQANTYITVDLGLAYPVQFSL